MCGFFFENFRHRVATARGQRSGADRCSSGTESRTRTATRAGAGAAVGAGAGAGPLAEFSRDSFQDLSINAKISL